VLLHRGDGLLEQEEIGLYSNEVGEYVKVGDALEVGEDIEVD
jgi:hypothetical protein